jgi:tetratricopeptide (TPR) repeat protein
MPIQIADTYGESEFAQRQTGLLFNLPHPPADVEPLPEGISLCMIVKNEERFLAECLNSVRDVVDEICIYDTGSTDRTLEIAKEFGAKIELGEWRNDFSWARNQSLKMATRRWTLVLDADEELMPESVHLLRSLRTVPADLTTVYLRIVNQVDDYSGAGTLSHNLPRVFPTNPRIRYRNVIHEGLTLDGGEIRGIITSLKILHKGYTRAIIDAKDKGSRNMPLLEKAVAQDENDSFALFNFGVAAVQAGNYEEGITALNKMFAIVDEPRMYHALGAAMLAIGYVEARDDYEKAFELLDDGIAKFPTDPGLLFTKAQLQVQAKRYDDAKETFDKLLSIRREASYAALTDDEIYQWKAYYALAGSYVAQNDVEKALEYLELALTNKPDSSFILVSKARALERLERFHDANVAFRQLSELKPDTGRVEYINFLLRRKRFSTALVMIESQLADADPPTAARLNAASANAIMAESLGDPVPFLESALRHAPGCGSALRLYEQLLTERGETERLEQLHREELEAELVFAEDYVRRAYRLLALGRSEEAREVAQRGVEVDATVPELRYNYAMAALRLGDEGGALRALRQIPIGDSETHVMALATEASLLAKRGDVDAGVASLDRLLGFAPNNVDALLLRARLLDEAGRATEAKASLEPSARNDQRIALQLAGMLMRDGDIAGAGRVATLALQ